jgi:endonuclease YncB( thermonuclease family)
LRQGRRQLAIGFAGTVCAIVACAAALARPALAQQAPAAVPYWQAPALPAAVIQGGSIPSGWQPQAVPYQGIGPDGKPTTMFFAPTYVFTYQSGPPVLAVPQASRSPLGVNRPGIAGQPYTPAWNYQTSGVAPAATALPPATVARYAPQPYQFPANSRALTGTPLTPPGALPGQPAPPPQTWGVAPAQMPQQATAPFAQPPQQWVPSNETPPPGVTPQPTNQWTGVAAPAVAGAAGAAMGAAVASSGPTAQPQMAPLPPPVAPIPSSAGGQPLTAQPVSSGGLTPPVQAAAPQGTAANTHQWKVVAVYDGDTVTCIDENNQQQKIRLAEIDAPEAKQDFGQVSRQALASMVFGKTITVVDDGRDRYGRWIGHLYADGVDVNRQMVATGMAWNYSAYSKDQSLAALQSQAQAQKLGIWSQPNPIPPSEYRKSGSKKSA